MYSLQARLGVSIIFRGSDSLDLAYFTSEDWQYYCFEYIYILYLIGTGSTNQSEILIDLVGLDIQSPSASEQQPPASSQSFPADLLCGSAATDPPSQSVNVPSTALSLLDEELLSLGNIQHNVV